MAFESPFLPNVVTISLRGRIGRFVRPEDVSRQLHLAERLPFIRGVLLRIDSAGGAASESDQIRREIARVGEDKPVVAHIHGVGASGAYLIATAARRIVASDWSLVGSIGVLLMRPNVTDLLERIGVGVAVRKTGKFKDLGSPFRPPTPEDEEKDRALIDTLCRAFVATVADARKLDPGDVEKLATGEVFTGSQAKDVGLVDVVGDEEAARDELGELIGGKVRPLEFRLPGGGIRRLRPAAVADRIAGPLGSLSLRPTLEWPGGLA